MARPSNTNILQQLFQQMQNLLNKGVQEATVGYWNDNDLALVKYLNSKFEHLKNVKAVKEIVDQKHKIYKVTWGTS